MNKTHMGVEISSSHECEKCWHQKIQTIAQPPSPPPEDKAGLESPSLP